MPGRSPRRRAALWRSPCAGLEAQRVRVEAVENRHPGVRERVRERREEAAAARDAGGGERGGIGAHGEDRQAILARQLRVDRPERRQQRGPHVRVEVGHVDPGGERALDLRAQLDRDVLGLRRRASVSWVVRGRQPSASSSEGTARAPATGPQR